MNSSAFPSVNRLSAPQTLLNYLSMEMHVHYYHLMRAFGGTLCLVAILTSGSAQSYHVTDLGSASQFAESYSINDNGDISGRLMTSFHALYWPHGKAPEDIGAISGTSNTFGYSINNSRKIAGTSSYGSTMQGFVWSPEAGMMGLSPLQGDLRTDARCINDAGVVVGVSINNSHTIAVKWTSPGSPVALGTLGGNYSKATAINASGVIVGVSGSSGVFWDSHGPHGISGTRSSQPLAINDLSHIVGFAAAPFTGARAFFWSARTGIQDIGLYLDEDYSEATAINNQDQVVGDSRTGSSDPVAFIWTPTSGSKRLESLLDASGVGWELVKATDINDRGEILGQGYLNGDYRQFLLTPTSLPARIGR